MIHPPINDLLEKTGTRYSLVILASKRARQIGMDTEDTDPGSYDEAILKAVGQIHDGSIKAVPYAVRKVRRVAQEALQDENGSVC